MAKKEIKCNTYETKIVNILKEFSDAMFNYWHLSKKVKANNLQEILDGLDNLNEAVCRGVDELNMEFNVNIPLENPGYISDETIRLIARDWKLAQYNFDVAEKKGYKLDAFGYKHGVMNTSMLVIANKITLKRNCLLFKKQ